MKNLKWASIIKSLIYIAAGLLLLFFPGQAADLACYVIGIALIIFGVVNVISYFMLDLKDSLFRNDFAMGIVWILIGFMVIHEKEAVQKIVPFMLAIVIFASGISKLQDALDIKRITGKASNASIVMACISIVFGLVVMLGKINGMNLLFQIIGAGLLYSGVTDLYMALYISGKIKSFKKKVDDMVVDARIEEAKEAEHASDTDQRN